MIPPVVNHGYHQTFLPITQFPQIDTPRPEAIRKAIPPGNFTPELDTIIFYVYVSR